MWELIAANKRRSVVLIAAMGVFMAAAGMVIAEAMVPGAFIFGGFVALLLWGILSLVSYYGSDAIFLASAGARQIQKEDHPVLYNIVEEMSIAAGLSKPPKVYIIDDPRPNAFAVGRDPDHASVAVTAGLLNRLDRDEVQGVVAHEIGHVHNRDILYVMLAAMMVGVIALLADIFLRYTWYTGGRHRGRRSRGGQAEAVLMLIALLFAILGPLAAQLLYFALSRRREYLADANGALFTRYPEGLASALEKIAADPGMAEQKNRVMAPMYIVNPMAASGKAVSLFSTHPPTAARVRVLRSMAGASLSDYEAAYQRATGRAIVPRGALETSRPVGVRPAWRPEEVREPPPHERVRATNDLLWRLNRYVFVDCPCGARLKVPPGYRAPDVRCPRCGRFHEVARG